MDPERCLTLFDQMRTLPGVCKPDITSFNIAFNALAKRAGSGDISATTRCLALLEEIRATKKIQSDAVTYNSALNVLTKDKKAMSHSLQLYDDMRATKRFNTSIATSLILSQLSKMCSDDHTALDKMLLIFEDAKKTPNSPMASASYNCMMHALVRGGTLATNKKALELLDEMKVAKTLRPTHGSYALAFQALTNLSKMNIRSSGRKCIEYVSDLVSKDRAAIMGDEVREIYGRQMFSFVTTQNMHMTNYFAFVCWIFL